MGLRDASLEELTGMMDCGGGGGRAELAGGHGCDGGPPAPSVDSLNDMLK